MRIKRVDSAERELTVRGPHELCGTYFRRNGDPRNWEAN
jgi:hypothetical protein